MKIITLGNEFIKEDSLAKKVGEKLSKDFKVTHVKDSFQLMGIITEEENLIVIDVVQGLDSVKEIEISQLRNDSILSAHDFDAGYVLSLCERPVRIIGIPMEGSVEEVLGVVRDILR